VTLDPSDRVLLGGAGIDPADLEEQEPEAPPVPSYSTPLRLPPFAGLGAGLPGGITIPPHPFPSVTESLNPLPPPQPDPPPEPFSPDEELMVDSLLTAAEVYDPMRWSATSPETRRIAEAIVRLARNYPELVELASESYDHAAAMTALEGIISGIGQLTGTEPDMGGFIRAAFDMLDEMGNTFRTTETFMRDIEADADLSQRLTTDFTEIAERLDVPVSITQTLTGEWAEVWNRSADFVGEFAGVDTTPQVRVDGRRMVINFPGPRDGEDRVLDVVFDEGTEINNTHDVFVETARARLGLAHQVLLEDSMGGDNRLMKGIGRVLNGAGNLWDQNNGWWNYAMALAGEGLEELRWGGGNSVTVMGRPLGRSEESEATVTGRNSATIRRERREKQAEELHRQIAAGISTPEALIVAAATELYRTNKDLSPLDAASETVEFFALQDPADIAALSDAVESNFLVSEEARKLTLEAVEGDESGLKSLLDTTVDGIVTVGAVYGMALDWLAVHVVDTLGDVGQGTLASVGLGGMVDYDGPVGFGAFGSTWDWTKENRVSEYFDIEGTAGLWVDIGANFFFDPLTWILPGQKAIIRNWTNMAARNPDKWLKMRTTRFMAESVVEANKAGNRIPLIGLLDGMDAKFFQRIRELDNVDEVLRALGEALPANGGNWIPQWSGRVITRNTALRVKDMATKTQKAPGEVQTWFRQILRGHSKDRAVSLAPSAVMDDAADLAIYLFVDHPELSRKWFDEITDTVVNYLDEAKSAGTVGAASLTDIATQIRRLKRSHGAWARKALGDVDVRGLPKGAARQVRRIIDDTDVVDQTLRAIDSELTYFDELERTLSAEDLARVDDLRAQKAAISESGTRYESLVRERRALEVVPENVRSAESKARITEIERELSRMARQPRMRGLARNSDLYTEMATRHATFVDELAKLKKAKEKAVQLVASGGEPSREVFDRLYARMLDDFGRNVAGLKEVPGKLNPYLADEGVGALDWTPLVGDRAASHYNEAASRYAPFLVGVDEVEWPQRIAEMRDARMLTTPTEHFLPGSPQELVAGVVLKDGEWWQKPFVRGSAAKGVGERAPWAETVKGAVRSIQNLWAKLVLFGPKIAFRSVVDEQIRYALHGGRILPRTGSVTLDAADDVLIPGPMLGTASQMRPGLDLPDVSRMAARQEMRAYHSAPWNVDAAAWEVVGRGDRLHREATQRWVNGTLMGDPNVRPFTEAALRTAEQRGVSVLEIINTVPVTEWDLQPMREWWATTGRARGGTAIAGKGNLRMAGLDEAAETMRNSFRVLLNNVPEKQRARFADDFLARVRDRNILNATPNDDNAEWLIRHFGPVPADMAGAMGGGPTDWFFHLFYGKPGENRFGLIHTDFMDRSLSVYRDAEAAGNLRVLRPEQLVELGYVDDIARARRMFIQQPDEVTRIATEHGMHTPMSLERQADRFARKQAKYLMYQPGATSMLGKTFQGVFPFGPAQYDFMEWWSHEARKAATVGAFGKHFQVPSLANMVGRGKTNAMGLNLRLMARAGEYSAAFAKVADRDDWDGTTPIDLLNETTFLPDLTDGTSLAIDLGPPWGPIPVAIIRMLPSPDDEPDHPLVEMAEAVRGFLNDMSPTLTFGPDVDFGNLGTITRALIPFYQGSALDVVADLFDQIADQNITTSPLQRDAFDSSLADYLSRGDYREIFANLDNINSAARRTVNEFEAGASSLRFLPITGLWVSKPDLTTDMWEPMVGDLEAFVGLGLLGDAQRDELTRLWAKHQTDELSEEERRDLHTGLRNVLFGLKETPQGRLARAVLLARNPELAIPLTGRYGCRYDPDTGRALAPAGCDGRGRPLLPDDSEEALAMLSEGLTKRWYRELPTEARVREVQWRVASAQRQLMHAVYRQILPERNSFDPWAVEDLKAAQGRTIPLTEPQIRDLKLAGVENVESGMLVTDLMGEMRRANYRIGRFKYPLGIEGKGPAQELENSISADPDAHEFINSILPRIDAAYEDAGALDFSDWSEHDQQLVRDTFDQMTKRRVLSIKEYNETFAGFYGPIDWKSPVLPPITEIPDRDVIQVDPGDVEVVDGDTLDVTFADGESVRYRLIGVNAPDRPIPGWQEAFLDLSDLINSSDDVALVLWQPEVYGTTAGEDYETGEERLKMWLYVNGVAVYHPEVFTFRNPTGRSSGSEYRPLPRPPVLSGDEELG